MQEEEVDKGSDSGEMEAGLQIDTGALLLEMAGTEGALGLQVPQDNGPACAFPCPSKQCSEACHRHTGKLKGLLLFPDVHPFPHSSWITGPGRAFLWKITWATCHILWNEGPV